MPPRPSHGWQLWELIRGSISIEGTQTAGSVDQGGAMCRFHSFVVTPSLDFLEKSGAVHHSDITSADVLRYALLPEFDLVQRRLDLDGSTLIDALTGHSRPAVPAPAGYRPGRTYANGEDFLGEEALRALERYLWKRFGTREKLVSFAEPWWEEAKHELLSVGPVTTLRRAAGALRPPRPTDEQSGVYLGNEGREHMAIDWLCARGRDDKVTVDPAKAIRIRLRIALHEEEPEDCSARARLARLTEALSRKPKTARRCLVMVFRDRGSRRPLLWAGPLGIVESTDAQPGPGVVAFIGKAVLDPYTPTRALNTSPSVELYEANLDQTQALMANATDQRPVAHEELTYERWAQAVLDGDCVSTWLHDLDLDHALGFSRWPSCTR